MKWLLESRTVEDSESADSYKEIAVERSLVFEQLSKLNRNWTSGVRVFFFFFALSIFRLQWQFTAATAEEILDLGLDFGIIQGFSSINSNCLLYEK